MTPPYVEVTPAARGEVAILANLLELYVHDFSEYTDLEPGPDGRFGYPDLPLYWREPGRHPFLIRMDGKLAGFALVKRGAAWDMAEFFVLRGYRRRRIGTDAAHQVWRRFPGRWEVRVMEANRPAYRFWERAIALFCGAAIPAALIEKGSRRWSVFSFESFL
jgi:predicted acetyltransferase